jgi:hypothetical protein
MQTPSSPLSNRIRLLFLALSGASVIACAIGATLHYSKRAWGNGAHPAGWLLAMLFLLLAFSSPPRQIVSSLRASLNLRTGFFAFWIVFFTASHLWHFSTAPWNGDGLFDESGWDLWFLKSYVAGHPFQPAWFHSPISRETLFHYYLVPFFKVFGYNILAYEAGLFVIWLTMFFFTLRLVHLLFDSYLVTSLTALVSNFLPFSFIYTFAGYRYPMATALCTMSLYYLYRGFSTKSRLDLALGGVTAGLCLASSISGKQYLAVLLASALLHPLFKRGQARWSFDWPGIAVVAFGWLAAATPILCYIIFNREAYTLYESDFLRSFLAALRGHPAPNDLSFYFKRLWDCFFHVPGNRFFIPDALPIPLPYYFFLVPGLGLAAWQKRFEVFLLATVPVLGALIATAYENRLLLAIPFWMVLMAFSFSALLRWQVRMKLALCGVAAVLLIAGLYPSVGYIYRKAASPFTIHHYAQTQVAVSRFLRLVVAGKPLTDPPRLGRNEFNRVRGPKPDFDTFVCQEEAYSIIHLFLHDYDDAKVLSFSDGVPSNLISERDILKANRNAVAGYVPRGKGLKLVWEATPKTDNVLKLFEPLRGLATNETISYSFGGERKKFYVWNISAANVPMFQERLRALPGIP